MEKNIKLLMMRNIILIIIQMMKEIDINAILAMYGESMTHLTNKM